MPALPITIVRGDAAPTMSRGDLPTGAVFSVKGRNGRLGKRYANMGHNGRAYSVNLDTRELASSGNFDTNCTLIGKWEFKVDRTHKRGVTGRQCARSEVRPGEIFVVKGKDTEYAHLGRIEKDLRGWLSIPLARQHNHAVTRNGDSSVEVVGTFELGVTLSA